MRLFPLLAAFGLALLFLWWFKTTPPQQVAKRLRQALLWLGGGLLIFLAASGRLHWLFALFAALAPFLQRMLRLLQFLPLLQRLRSVFNLGKATAGPAAGKASQVRTRFLHMRMDHDSGELSGQVLEGEFAGYALDQLELSQLLGLLQTCRSQDPQSAAVLEAYLNRRFGDEWQSQDQGAASGTPEPGPMTREQALDILGLEPGADRAAILAAHKRLMQKLHPDRGGSTWLASRVNQAKDLLLKS